VMLALTAKQIAAVLLKSDARQMPRRLRGFLFVVMMQCVKRHI